MPSDRSRRTDGLRDGYTGVVAQQGRVTLDRDVNAEHGFIAGRIEAEARDVIGPCGTPDDGFAISLPQASPPGPPLWSPPAPLSPPMPHAFDFLIGPGTMYVGGQRAVFEARPAGHPVTYSYFDQPDWVRPPAPAFSFAGFIGVAAPPPPGRELVFLALAEQEVSAIEDSDLLDVALGGPDTTQRLRLLRRVEREPVGAGDCTAAWAQAVALWRARAGLALDPASMRLQPQVRLQVGFSNTGGPTDPCDPIAQGGYLGAENQTIRVQIANPGGSGSPGGEASLMWGYDNASFLYRATPVASNPAMLTIAPQPPDQFHIPQAGQVVEILRTAAVLASEPDVTDTSGRRTIVRAVANPTGVIRRLVQPYGPANPGDATNYIVLDEALPGEFLEDTTPLFLRVWQSEIAFDPAGDTILLTDDVTGASTGVEVTLSLPPGGVLTHGAFWLLAVRPSTPQAVYPERLLTAPQPPDGPRLWACPLAVIDWSNRQTPTITDCRNQFDNLVELSRRRAGCCTLAVFPAAVAGGAGLQHSLDRAAQLEPGATLCLAPGRYQLTAPLRLTAAHTGITLDCCGGAAILTAAAGHESAFSDGVFVLAGARGVTLRGLHVIPPLAPLPDIAARDLLEMLSGVVQPALARRIVGSMRSAIAVHAADSPALVLEACFIEFARTVTDVTPDIFGAGVMLQGDCSGLQIRDCTVRSRIQPSFNRVTALRPQPALGAEIRASIGSPPVPTADFQVQMLNVARSALATIAGRTQVADAAVASNVLVVTVGVLAMFNLGDGRPSSTVNAPASRGVPCLLGDSTLRDSRFDNLTMALYGLADTDALRMQDNDVGQCIGGFWLQLTGWQPPRDPKAAELFHEGWAQTEAFAERLLLDAVGLTYPLPPGAAGDATQTAAGPATLFVTGNQIEAVPSSRSGTTALLLLANRPPQGTEDLSASLIIANNRLRSRSGPAAPTALLLVPEQQRCAITGNLILSEGSADSHGGPSLWIAPDDISNGTFLLSVVGNVIEGRSDLSALTRTGVTPPQTWVNYNAMPS